MGTAGAAQPDCREALAAERQANYGLGGLWIGGLQLLALFGQIVALVVTIRQTRIAASAAVKSADAADRSVVNSAALLAQAREASERDLRAWVSISLDLTECHRKVDAGLTLRAEIVNIGKTPAVDVAVSIKVHCVSSFVSDYGSLPAPESQLRPMPSLMPGATADQTFGLTVSKAELDAGAAAARAAKSTPMLVVDAIVLYRAISDQDGAPRRMTSIRYLVIPNITDPRYTAARAGWLDNDGPAGVDQVLFRQNKSAPVHMS